MFSPDVARRLCLALITLLLGSLIGPARIDASGVNLSWNDCGTSGVSNKNFACNTNSGSAVLVGSFVPPTGIDSLLGIAATIDIWSAPDSVGTAMPDWWSFATGGCRAGALSLSFDFTSASACLDPWGGSATGGLDYAIGVPSANHATLRLVGAVPAAVSVAADSEYYAFKFSITATKTTGAGSCSGCSSPISISLTSLTLTQTAPAVDVVLSAPVSSALATWQGGAGLAPALPSPQPITYGQIRSLYH